MLLAGRRGFQLVFAVAFMGLSGLFLAKADDTDLGLWGSDHVGQELPEYITGDECLFCHRDIGPNWPSNPHQTTLRLADAGQPEIQSLAQLAPDAASAVEFLLGDERLVRYLKRSKAYGQLDLLSTRYAPNLKPTNQTPAPQVLDTQNNHWHSETFADRCAGCHTTAVDSMRRSFAATSLDCYTCHGTVVAEHSSDVSKVLLSKLPQNPLVVNSICSSCHLRGGASQTTKLPYPNNFVPGDNLFLDFQVALSDMAIAALPPMQQHIYLNSRLVGSGHTEPTCIDCHSVHGNHSQQHIDLRESRICASCHVPGTDNSQLLEAIQSYDKTTERNTTCDY